MLDHTRRIILVLVIFVASGWLYKKWRQDHGGFGLFDMMKGGKDHSSATVTSEPKLSSADVPNLARLSEESVKLAASVLPAVVSINTINLGKVNVPLGPFFSQQTLGWVPGLGSGVIVSKEGHVITNLHVIKNIAQDQNGVLQIKVTMDDGTSYAVDSAYGVDEDFDIAVLRIKSDRKDFPTLSFANSDDVRTGQVVFAAGVPFGLKGTFTQGIISATGRRFNDVSNALLQTDTVINPGNSGGPLVDVFGRMVGINVAIYPGDPNVHAWQGIGLAIPANDAWGVFNEYLNPGGYLGMMVEEKAVLVTAPAAPDKRFNGTVIKQIEPKSSAARAGLQPGDVVILMDGRPFEKPDEFVRAARRTPAGTSRELDVIRGDRRMKIIITPDPRRQGP